MHNLGDGKMLLAGTKGILQSQTLMSEDKE